MSMVTNEPRGIALLTQVNRLLAEARTVDECKELRDKAEAVRVYLKQSGASRDAINQATEVKIWSEYKAGQILRELPLNGGDRKSESAAMTLKLSDLGITRNQSSQWQRLAELDEETIQDHINEVVGNGGILTSASVLAKWKKPASEPVFHESPPSNICTDLNELIASGQTFGTVYADPPWRYDNKATRANVEGVYAGTMSVDEICDMPVCELAADDAHLHLWVTKDFIFDAKRVIEAWGFEYKSMFIWGKPQMGMGNYWRISHEILLLGVRGDAKRFNDRSIKSWAVYDRREHSEKPDEVRQLIERVSPGPFLELFGRKEVPNWTVFGNQVAPLPASLFV